MEFAIRVELLEEAGLVAFVADAGAVGRAEKQEGVGVAIGADLFDFEEVAGGFAFEPEFIPGAGVEAGFAGLQRFGEGFFVHEADHEDALGLPVLNDGGDEAIEF